MEKVRKKAIKRDYIFLIILGISMVAVLIFLLAFFGKEAIVVRDKAIATTNQGEFQVNATGMLPEGRKIFADIKEGRFFNQKEYDSAKAVCVIDEEGAKRLFGQTDVLGEKVEVTLRNTKVTFTIVGIRKPKPSGIFKPKEKPINLMFPLTLYK